MTENPVPKKYAFEGKIIKLSEADYNMWCSIYSAMPDMRSFLYTLDVYYAAEAEDNPTSDIRKRWFVRTASVLLKRNNHYIQLNKIQSANRLLAVVDSPEQWDMK